MSDWWTDGLPAATGPASAGSWPIPSDGGTAGIAPGTQPPRSSWPQVTDYLDAIERYAFADGSPLSALRPVDGGFFGGPIVLSGRAAVVFCMEDPSNNRHALRVFLSEPSPNLAAIGRLSGNGLPVPYATWHAEGVQIGGEWWPAQLLPWVEGTPLDLWMVRHRDDPAGLRNVATTIIEQISAMSERGIVHGDLQHGNILVTDDGDVTFVDLDGLVCCNPTTGLILPDWYPPTEAGHPNYQHPERTEKALWSPCVDLYSSLVIDVALRAVAIDPRLVDKFYVEDNLLLVRSDLDDPADSEVLDGMLELGDEAVTRRCEQLIEFSRQSVVGYRTPEGILHLGELPVGTPYSRPWYADLHSHEVSSDWQATDEMVSPPAAPVAPPTPTAVPAAPGSTSVPATSPLPPTADMRTGSGATAMSPGASTPPQSTNGMRNSRSIVIILFVILVALVVLAIALAAWG